jgi:hypothetical protein
VSWTGFNIWTVAALVFLTFCGRPAAEPRPPAEHQMSFEGIGVTAHATSVAAPAGQHALNIRLEISEPDKATAAFGRPPFGGTLVKDQSIVCVRVAIMRRVGEGLELLDLVGADLPMQWTARPTWCPAVATSWTWHVTIGLRESFSTDVLNSERTRIAVRAPLREGDELVLGLLRVALGRDAAAPERTLVIATSQPYRIPGAR